MAIQTVHGPIDAAELGPTSMHEHLLVDARVWHMEGREEPPADPKMTMENLGFVHWNVMSLEDNLIIDDPELAIRELGAFGSAGGYGIVDLTVIGLGRRVREIPRISAESGVKVMLGCGFYVNDSHPDWVEDSSVDELADLMVSELEEGIDGTDIRAALIGEIGTTDPFTERERKVLHAAGQAGARTGAAVNVHLDPRGTRGVEAVEVLVSEGMSADRVILSHMDERLDRGYHRAVAETGAVLEYDTFGSEHHFSDWFKDPSDLERVEYVGHLLEDGFGDQLVLGCDVWVKGSLRTYGGMGYDHILKRIVPVFRKRLGLDDNAINQMLIETPRRLLDR